MRRIPIFGPLQCQFLCKLPSAGLKSFPLHGQSRLDHDQGGTESYAWCGTCRAERCWDCGAVGVELTAPIRVDRKYRICEDCF